MESFGEKNVRRVREDNRITEYQEVLTAQAEVFIINACRYKQRRVVSKTRQKREKKMSIEWLAWLKVRRQRPSS